MVKVRIQILSGENPGVKYGPLKVSRLINAEGGLPAFYRGLDAALMRHFIYSSTKFGIFLNLSDYLRKRNNGNNISPFQKIFCGMAAGCGGSLVGNPTDMILIR